ncbi:uncharacterized protein PG986_004603 [Apiospora aurea]|uniref:Uncharacterized protein n=1 Tax=Apiospora aurea TaxID=335848 RepID=A0ABR1QN19_9PEZI
MWGHGQSHQKKSEHLLDLVPSSRLLIIYKGKLLSESSPLTSQGWNPHEDAQYFADDQSSDREADGCKHRQTRRLNWVRTHGSVRIRRGETRWLEEVVVEERMSEGEEISNVVVNAVVGQVS